MWKQRPASQPRPSRKAQSTKQEPGDCPSVLLRKEFQPVIPGLNGPREVAPVGVSNSAACGEGSGAGKAVADVAKAKES